jgi:hypothetical protein
MPHSTQIAGLRIAPWACMGGATSGMDNGRKAKAGLSD